MVGEDSKVKSYVESLLAEYSGPKLGEGFKTYKSEALTANPEYMSNLRKVILQAMDMFWVEHLEVMDYMRSSVNLRAYGQRDPLVEYKREGLQMFKNMEISIGLEILKLIPQIQTNTKFHNESVKLQETKEDSSVRVGETAKKAEIPRTVSGDKIGRNDPCFCGSGKKYKKCGELNTEEHVKNINSKK